MGFRYNDERKHGSEDDGNGNQIKEYIMQQVRRENIKEMLHSAGFVNVQELVNQFGVSSETIRRDLEAMEKEGLVRRIHGGAVSTRPLASKSAYTLRRKTGDRPCCRRFDL